MENQAQTQLVNFLEQHSIPYRSVPHPAEGRTDVVSELRGNHPHQAVKAMVLMAKHGKKDRSYYLAAIPGDARINFAAIREIAHADEVRFAPEDRAAELTGCTMGSVPPISFNPNLKLVVDPTVAQQEEVVFNAASLTESFFVPAKDFFAAAGGVTAEIAER